MKQNLELFGSLCLNFLKTQPIGSLSKRELEVLKLLDGPRLYLEFYFI